MSKAVDIKSILDAVRTRESDSQWGIGVASAYLKSIEPCLAGSALCPTNVFGLKSADEWVKAIAESESKLVYCNNDMLVKGFETTGLVSGSIMDFDAILTTSQKDRDGDILETKGAFIDPQQALLFNHIPMMPVGGMRKVLSKTDEHALCGYSLAKTAMGHDMAALIELNALRMSHGFKPKAFEPIASKTVGGPPSGWYIKEFDVIESSLVPIPANVGAVITAFSRSKLTDAFVKSWAKSHYDARPPQGRGFDANALANGAAKGACACQGECKCQKSGVADGAGGTKAGVSNASVMGDVQSGGNTGTTPADPSPMRVSVKCPECGTSYDLTSVPAGVDLNKLSCPACGYGATEGRPAASVGDHGTSGTSGGVGNTTTNSVRTISGPVTEKEGRVISASNHGRLKSCESHMSASLKSMSDAHNEIKSIMKLAGKRGDNLTDDMNDSIGDKNFAALVAKAAEFDEAIAPANAEAALASAFKKYLGGCIEPHLRGSFEWVSRELEKGAVAYLRSKSISFSQETRADVLGTYGDYAIVCVRDWSADTYPCFRIGWSMDEAGAMPVWSGDPRKVEITATVVEKALAARSLVAGVQRIIASGITAKSVKVAAAIEQELLAVRDKAAMGADSIAEERLGAELLEVAGASN